MKQPEIRIALVPIGPVANELLVWNKEHLPGYVNSQVMIADTLALPDQAYDKGRKQFLGDAVLKELQFMNVQADRIVGLIDQDCYVPSLNFIFGLASSKGKHSFVALPRLRQSLYGQQEDSELFRQRVLKEIIHELGHTWNLPHCPNPACIMYFSNMLRDTDIKGPGFCDVCVKRLPKEVSGLDK